MDRKFAVLDVVLLLFSMLAVLDIQPIESGFIAPNSVSGNYPYQNVFKKDLLQIANSVSEIQFIEIDGYLDMRPIALVGHIVINYTSGLSDFEKIGLQGYVQNQLESKWYIDLVEPNYIYWIPEDPPPPYPYVIGELLVRFVQGNIVIKVPDYYPTIQEAINDADAGDTVFVRNGTYYESVVVNKTVLLVGESKDNTVLDGNGTETIIHIAANNVTIANFTIRNGEQGIKFKSRIGISIKNNLIENTSHGISVEGGSSDLIISENEVMNNQFTGIYLFFVNNSTIVRNKMRNNQQGMIMLSNYFSEIIGNSIVENFVGITLSYSCSNIFQQNTLRENNIGIYLLESGVWTLENQFRHNNLINNVDQIIVDGMESLNFWDNGVEGNYWSDYSGLDVNGDGIGDSPYIINEYNQDNHPLMNLYWNPSDINHDLKVDIKDIATAAVAFGSYPGHERWNPHADITGSTPLEPDGKVDIRDIGLIAINFGKEYS